MLNPPLNCKKRNGDIVPFDAQKIANAITNAFANQNKEVLNLDALLSAIANSIEVSSDGVVDIERIQDTVEKKLAEFGYFDIAKAYILYREEHRQQRQKETRLKESKTIINKSSLFGYTGHAFRGLSGVAPDQIIEDVRRNLPTGDIAQSALDDAIILSVKSFIERNPNYSFVAARILLQKLKRESHNIDFSSYIHRAIKLELLHPSLGEIYNLNYLAKHLEPLRDLKFNYLGLRTLYDRYFLEWDGVRFELPQYFFMRVAMGLALNERDPNERAIEFYNLLSKFDLMCSTPTLFNSGSMHPQLSSCFVSTISDDLGGIYNAIKDNALMQKWAGGIGNDWTPVRGMGAYIGGTNGKSQGTIPFMKVANDTLVAVNQGGRRRGSGCAYLACWHIDILEFLELRKNTGDDRRRTHDMNTSNWIDDLFMERVHECGQWTLFSPDEVPDLHDLYGPEFDEAYKQYEALADQGKIKIWKRMSAVELWRKMLTMLFETGHPWICFKTSSNMRNPQQHVGVVHSSNLCTEVVLNTNADEIAVCNLASVNLANHIKDGNLDKEKLQRTIRTGMRMLDNVVDINAYPVPQTRNSNLTHRPVGLGVMGFQDALYQLGIPYASQEAMEFADRSMEAISYYAISASSDLAVERGSYSTFEGSLWSQGVLPIDSLVLYSEYHKKAEFNYSQAMDWAALRERVKTQGMRNSHCMAIAPTATIANVCGVTQSIEPTYQNLFVKSNLSGEFSVVNSHLYRDLIELDLLDDQMISDLKYHDGSVQMIERIPFHLRELYATAFEIEPEWLLKAAARRAKWIDQSQSLNLYMLEPSGKKLDAMYKLAWVLGLKTTYYLRAMGASRVEKSTCSINDPNCESCQ